MCVCVCI